MPEILSLTIWMCKQSVMPSIIALCGLILHFLFASLWKSLKVQLGINDVHPSSNQNNGVRLNYSNDLYIEQKVSLK